MRPKTLSEKGWSPVNVSRATGASGIVLVCEHASNHIPDEFTGLGLNEDVCSSHIAWDPGALGMAQRLSALLDAPLVAGSVSRLVYDCNRPPDVAGAMPARSETYDIPGNAAMSEGEKQTRIAQIYEPFTAATSETMTRANATVLITIHSFTKVFLGKPREVEIGVLHDTDSRLADAMLSSTKAHTALKTIRNEPYGPADGVTHTLREHGIKRSILNVMIEVRNDLIATAFTQNEMAEMMAPWLLESITACHVGEAES